MPEKPSSVRTTPIQRRFSVSAEEAGLRLDRVLSAHFPELSRSQLQRLVDEGRVQVNGAISKRAHHASPGEEIHVEIPPPRTTRIAPQDIPLAVLYEDPDVAVVNKPAGLIVHPGAGDPVNTLAGALLHRFGRLSGVGGELRPGIVHRLDKGTSGALIVARTDAAHRSLVEQFQERTIEKTYVALLHGQMKEDSGRILLPVSRDLHRRARMTTRRREGRPARTDWRVRLRLSGYTLVEADLHTGRTHQIRVHFSSLGHAVVGDTLYGAPREAFAGGVAMPHLDRNFLHAARVGFLHPRTGKPVEVRAPLPEELKAYLHELGKASGADPALIDDAVRPFL
ncbi:MAG: RluA family pseudouridine synthase [Candidatus Acidiferrales bacterium]